MKNKLTITGILYVKFKKTIIPDKIKHIPANIKNLFLQAFISSLHNLEIMIPKINPAIKAIIYNIISIMINKNT